MFRGEQNQDKVIPPMDLLVLEIDRVLLAEYHLVGGTCVGARQVGRWAAAPSAGVLTAANHANPD